MKNRATKTTTVYPSQKMPARRSDVNEKYREDQRQMMREGVAEAMQQVMQERYNAMPFKNNAINLFDRQRYGISREFDGQEVEGTMMERPTAGGGRMEVERFNNMPGGGSRVERTRYNAEDMPVNRTIKDRKINKR
jgi:hypothetical protein